MDSRFRGKDMAEIIDSSFCLNLLSFSVTVGLDPTTQIRTASAVILWIPAFVGKTMGMNIALDCGLVLCPLAERHRCGDWIPIDIGME